MSKKGAGHKVESAYGLFGVVIAEFPKIQSSTWDTDPALCDGIIADQLNSWIFNAEEFLIAQGAIGNAGIDSKEALYHYMERIEAGKIDSTALAYKLIYDSRMARRALLVSVTADGLTRNAHKASYHILHATACANKFWLLKEEKIIQDGRKTAKNFREGISLSNQNRREDALLRQAQWQKWAIDIWNRKPDLSKTSMARILKENHHISETENTIRAKIQKPDRAN